MSITELNPADNKIMADAREYIEYGFALVPLQQNSKQPVYKDWPNKLITRRSEELEILYGIGLAHGESKTAVVDVDALVRALAAFHVYDVDLQKHLNDPKSVKIISGMENRSKLLYRLPAGIEPLISIKRDADGYELRCITRKGTSLQDVLPPSTHPKTGRKYVWDGDWRNIPILPDDILRMWLTIHEERASREWEPLEDKDLIEPFIDSALTAMDPDMEYNRWLSLGMALDSVGWGDKWDEWSQRGKTYQLGDCERRLLGFTPEGGVTLGTFWHEAKAAGWESADAWDAAVDAIEMGTTRVREAARKLALAHRICKRGHSELGLAIARLAKFYNTTKTDFQRDVNAELNANRSRTDLTHREISSDYRKSLKDTAVTEGALWVYGGGLWSEKTMNEVIHEVGEKYKDQERCKTGPQYNSIARLVITENADPTWFVNAPKGICCTDGFYEIREGGELIVHSHAPEQRQRYLYDVVPDKEDSEAPLLERLFECVDDESRFLIQQFSGAVLFQLATEHQQALLLYGDTGTGKSEFIKLLQSVVTNNSTIPPNKFHEDYWRAKLAGSLLNCYTELPAKDAIDSSEFKAILAGDLVSARIVQQPVFQFHPLAGHIFSANALPTVDEPSEAFWRRWLISTWTGTPSHEEKNFHLKILKDELPQFMRWCIEGAQAVIKNEGYITGAAHERTITTWKEHHNVVLQALYSDDTPFIMEKGLSCRTTQFAKEVQGWASANGIEAGIRKNIIAIAKKHLQVKLKDGYQIFEGVGVAFDRE